MSLAEGEELTEIEIGEIESDIREFQINQTLMGLQLMPHMRPMIEKMAARGDDIAKEVLRRFNVAE